MGFVTRRQGFKSNTQEKNSIAKKFFFLNDFKCQIRWSNLKFWEWSRDSFKWTIIDIWLYSENSVDEKKFYRQD